MADVARPVRARSLPWRDTAVTAAACAAVVVLILGPAAGFQPGAIHQILTLAAAAVGVGAAILAVVVSRLLDDPRPSWLASALVLYCVVVLPWATVHGADLTTARQASRIVAYATVLVLLLMAVAPPRAMGAWGGWVVLLAGGMVAFAALRLPDTTVVRALTASPLTAATVAGWTLVGIGVVVDGHRRSHVPRVRLGLGLVVIGASQSWRVLAGTAAVVDPTFAALRLLGLVLVLIGVGQLLARAVSDLRAQHQQQQEELTRATLAREQAQEIAAERRHELRNGLAGLAGITHLLNRADPDHRNLEHAVLAELGRLRSLIDDDDPDNPYPDPFADLGDRPTDYRVQPVIAGLVALRGPGSGGRLELRVEPDLWAYGDSAVLAQVVTNVLLNCDRHAPGTPIRVRAGRRGDTVEITVRDAGPGLTADVAPTVLDRGVPDRGAPGSGLGLHISRRLLGRQGGTLDVRTVERPRGCLVTIAVPAADPVPGAADHRAGATERS